MKDVLTHQQFRKRIWQRWQFWLILIIAIFITGWVNIRIQVWGNMSELRVKSQDMQANQEAYLEIEEYVRQEVENDTYGGATPEETLEMLVDALDVRDYTTAAKYITLDEREEFTNNLQNPLSEDGIQSFINAYRNGTLEVDDEGWYYKMILTEPGDEIGFHISATYNEFTKIWKLSSF